MEYQESLDKLLAELKEHTGISFSVDGSSLSEEDTIKKVKELVNRTHSGNNRIFLMRQFLMGQLMPEEFEHAVARFHMKVSAPRVMLLLEFPQPVSDVVRSVIEGLYSAHTTTLVQMDDRHLVLIRNLDAIPSQEEVKDMAMSIMDMLNAEAMTKVYVAAADPITLLSQLPQNYQDLSLTMKIGRTFYSTDHVYSSHELGLGRLVYALPEAECRRYMDDHFKDFDFRELDSDTLHAVHTFFENSLNIAETARQLFIHRNTLVYRLDKFQKMSGLDIRNFEDAITVKLGMMMMERL